MTGPVTFSFTMDTLNWLPNLNIKSGAIIVVAYRKFTF
jgi:hypothetical protein